VIVAGLFRFSLVQAFDFPPQAFQFDRDMLARLGATSILAMYSYGGYNQVCNIGEEIEDPARTMPRSIVLSIVVVAALYMLMTIVILGLLPWQEAKETRTIASVFIARTFADPQQGRLAALLMTVLIQFVAAASLYALILGYSRVPFTAARDGHFFPVFARVHEAKRFPHVSLLVVGLGAIPFCFFTLGQLASWIIQVQVLLCFVWQCAAVILLREKRKDIPQPFQMWLYPLPALLAMLLWLYVFLSGPWQGIAFSFAYLAAALLAFAIFKSMRRSAPPA
jgi:amino acid transporter